MVLLYRVNGIAGHGRALIRIVYKHLKRENVSDLGRTVGGNFGQTGASSVSRFRYGTMTDCWKCKKESECKCCRSTCNYFSVDDPSPSSPSATNAGARGATFDPSAQFVTADDGYEDTQWNPVTGGAVSGEMLEELMAKGWGMKGGTRALKILTNIYSNNVPEHSGTAGCIEILQCEKYAASDFSRW